MGKQEWFPGASQSYSPLLLLFSLALTSFPGWAVLPTAVGFCFPTLSLLCLREVLLCLSCLFQETTSREGEKKLSCLLLSAASTGRCGDRYKFSWNSYTVLYPCCRLQETLPKSPNQPGCAVFKVRRCWRNLRGPSGICSLCFLLHLPIQSEVSWLPLSDPWDLSPYWG